MGDRALILQQERTVTGLGYRGRMTQAGPARLGPSFCHLHSVGPSTGRRYTDRNLSTMFLWKLLRIRKHSLYKITLSLQLHKLGIYQQFLGDSTEVQFCANLKSLILATDQTLLEILTYQKELRTIILRNVSWILLLVKNRTTFFFFFFFEAGWGLHRFGNLNEHMRKPSASLGDRDSPNHSQERISNFGAKASK